MYKVSVESTSGYFLNHKLLTEQALNNAPSDFIYELKQELFIYTEKGKSSGEYEKKRKKAKKLEPNLQKPCSFLNLDHVGRCSTSLLTACQEYIPTLNQFANINPILEEPTEFPTLRGANNLNVPVITNFSNAEFLIPQKCSFFNDDIRNLTKILPQGEQYDLIVLDPPWRNKYIRRLKSARAELSYKMLYNEDLAEIPLELYVHQNSLVVIWCTNSSLHHKAILDTFLPKWNLKLLATWFWVKLNHKGELVGPFKDAGQKQPFEHIFIATHESNNTFHFKEEFVISVASIIHSHKPPLFELFKQHLPEEPKCLELFARYLYPGFTSVGLEVFKLQDKRFYNVESKQIIDEQK